jgi:hypothetical protein
MKTLSGSAIQVFGIARNGWIKAKRPADTKIHNYLVSELIAETPAERDQLAGKLPVRPPDEKRSLRFSQFFAVRLFHAEEGMGLISGVVLAAGIMTIGVLILSLLSCTPY